MRPDFDIRHSSTTAPKSRMRRFVLLSLCLHVAAILPGTSAFDFAGHRETVLTVSLDRPAATQPAPARRAGTTPQRTVTHASETIVPAGVAASTAAPAYRAETDRHDTQSESTRARVETKIFADLQRYFEYPTLARRRGWQGTVWLSFVVDSGGVLERIRVARGSGYDVLDDSAIAALRRVKHLPEADHWLNGVVLEMNIPIVYRLKDN